MACTTKMQLDAAYSIVATGGKVPEGLSPPARAQYEHELATIEGRDCFEITVRLPSWIPSNLKGTYHSMIRDAIDRATGPIVREARSTFGPGGKS